MLLKNRFFIVILITLLTSCQQGKKQGVISGYAEISYDSLCKMQEIDVIPIEIKFPQKPTYLNLENRLKDVSFIKLEKTENSLISRVDKILLENDLMYVLDVTVSKIFLFDLEGRHLKTINRLGRGPGEYMMIKDFTLAGDSIIIFDDYGKKLLFFDGNGEFCFEKPIGIRFRNIHRISNGNYIVAAGSAKNWFRPALDGYSILIGKPYDEIKMAGLMNNEFLKNFNYGIRFQFVQFQDELLYAQYLSNYIYRIYDDGKFYKKYHLNISNRLPDDYYKKSNPNDFQRYASRNNITYFMGLFVENDNHLFIQVNLPGRILGYLLYNKNDHTVIYYDGILGNDSHISIYLPLLAKNDYFVSTLDGSNIVKNLDILNKNPAISSENIALLNSIKIDDNPVLMFYSFN